MFADEHEECEIEILRETVVSQKKELTHLRELLNRKSAQIGALQQSIEAFKNKLKLIWGDT